MTGNGNGGWKQYNNGGGAYGGGGGAWGQGAWSRGMGPRPTKPKNWRCSGCGFTGNLQHWTWCGGAKCSGEWRPDDTGAGKLTAKDLANDAAKSSVDHELDDTRAHLVALVAALPPGHATIDEYAAKVAKLEAEKVTHVSTTDRLRALLADSTKLKKQKEATDAALNGAVKALEAASALVQTRVQACELATASFNANTLEIAELTRPERSHGAPEGTMVQALRAQLDTIPTARLQEQGITGAELTEFFVAFQNLIAKIDVAKTPVDAVAPAAPSIAPAVAVDPPPVLLLVTPDRTDLAPVATTAAPVATTTTPAVTPPPPTPTPTTTANGNLAGTDTDITPGQETQADKRLREGRADPHGDADMNDADAPKDEPLAAAATALKKAKIVATTASVTQEEADASDL